MKLLHLLVISLINFTTGVDVTTQNVIYHSAKRSEMTSGVMSTDLNRILIKGKSTLEWQDGHGKIIKTFDIKSVTGALALEESGEITYQVSGEKISGRFIVKKTDKIIRIKALLVADTKPSIVEFEITAFNILP